MTRQAVIPAITEQFIITETTIDNIIAATTVYAFRIISAVQKVIAIGYADHRCWSHSTCSETLKESSNIAPILPYPL